jgi:hypothetical protein
LIELSDAPDAETYMLRLSLVGLMPYQAD